MQVDRVKYFWSSDLSGQMLLILRFIRSNTFDLQTYQVKYCWSSKSSGQIILNFRWIRWNTFNLQMYQVKYFSKSISLSSEDTCENISKLHTNILDYCTAFMMENRFGKILNTEYKILVQIIWNVSTKFI